MVVDESNNEMHLYKMQFIMNELLEKKFGVESVEYEDELLPLDPKNLENDSYKLCKHAADRYVQSIQDNCTTKISLKMELFKHNLVS